MTHDPSDLRFTGAQLQQAERLLSKSSDLTLQAVEHSHRQALRSPAPKLESTPSAGEDALLAIGLVLAAAGVGVIIGALTRWVF